MFSKLRYLLRRRACSAGGIRYTIGGRVYTQRPLVLLQIEQLSFVFSQIQLPPGLSVVGIVQTLGGHLAEVLAIVLTPENVELDGKDLAATAAELRKSVDIETAVKVVEDFLFCNPVASVFDRLTGSLAKADRLLAIAGSPISSSSSPAGT